MQIEDLRDENKAIIADKKDLKNEKSQLNDEISELLNIQSKLEKERDGYIEDYEKAKSKGAAGKLKKDIASLKKKHKIEISGLKKENKLYRFITDKTGGDL